eukprot:SAG22_NODE_832_length_6935_cov_3.062317_2_plen_82_part_00
MAVLKLLLRLPSAIGNLFFARPCLASTSQNLVENDFTMFVRGFQILFKFAGSLAIGSGRDKVMYFANQLKDKRDRYKFANF